MNYFNTLPLRLQLRELGKCSLLDPSEYNGVEILKGKKIVIIGCGAQGLNQGLNLRDSGLDVSYALREGAITDQRQSWKNASENGFTVDTFDKLVPTADLVINLTPDKQHSNAVSQVMPMMKEGACLSYSHGFNIVEEGMQIRDDLTVIMVAPKSPGTEVREEYKRGFGVPTLIAVHTDNDPKGDGVEFAKAYAVGTGGHRAGVLMSSFVAEVKSDLMGEQTILCGMLQTGSILCYDKMIEKGIDAAYASKLVQQGWETITEALKVGGNTNMMNRLSNPAKIKAYTLAEELKDIMRSLYERHMDRIMTGDFSEEMMKDWANDDADLLKWREETNALAFEKSVPTTDEIDEQAYFDDGILMIAMVKAGVELAFESMVAAGIKAESAYYESLHEVPLIANLISRKKLYEMNRVISDTAEYGCYLFSQKSVPLLKDFMSKIETDVIGAGLTSDSNGADNQQLDTINRKIQDHPVEKIGVILRDYMTKNRN
ncbi:MAG: ketol-acid reductoisomerase [Deltaproteobacteria bacterium]|mgnify:CR=1 FL=1|jgi:ketol-acid reductoisomerase|nr:ketol-acid reductoisomerase [Deltaproteobacteria bacterium]MBT4526422.1 ketol-acid reductoisomerase [Deltaproteobacteria bacterium]